MVLTIHRYTFYQTLMAMLDSFQAPYRFFLLLEKLVRQLMSKEHLTSLGDIVPGDDIIFIITVCYILMKIFWPFYKSEYSCISGKLTNSVYPFRPIRQ